MPSTAAKAVRMSKKDMEKYRRLLEEKKTSLSSDLAKTRSAEEETTEESTQDIADKAVSSYTREFLYSLTDGERSTLLQIDDAINRIDDGTYGMCVNCGQTIDREAPARPCPGRRTASTARSSPRRGCSPTNPPSSSFARWAPVGNADGGLFFSVYPCREHGSKTTIALFCFWRARTAAHRGRRPMDDERALRTDGRSRWPSFRAVQRLCTRGVQRTVQERRLRRALVASSDPSELVQSVSAGQCRCRLYLRLSQRRRRPDVDCPLRRIRRVIAVNRRNPSVVYGGYQGSLFIERGAAGHVRRRETEHRRRRNVATWVQK